ncbi:MAG: hypothetical protein RL030_2714 [Pseudomonadota bacterium]|jgi:hypothetical protein
MIRVLVLMLVAANLLLFAWMALIGDDRPRLQAVTIAPRSVPLPPEAPPPPPPCTTLGPFAGEVAAESLQRQLEGSGWGVARREMKQQVTDGYWVYVAGLTSAADQARVLRALRRTGIQDAFVMPEDPEFRVSVGIFSEQPRAEDRARRVRVLKLDAQVMERMRDTTITWLDIPGVAPSTLGDGRLATAGISIGERRLENCPSPPPAQPPAASQSPGV